MSIGQVWDIFWEKPQALVLFHTTDLGFSLLPAVVFEGGLAQDKAR
jgi:hypothetical protein